jgi:hypothetical protein
MTHLYSMYALKANNYTILKITKLGGKGPDNPVFLV